MESEVVKVRWDEQCDLNLCWLMIIEDYMGFNHERYGIIVDIVDEY